MKATQGVILIMIAALVLFLTWSTRSVLQSPNTDSGSSTTTGTTPHPGLSHGSPKTSGNVGNSAAFVHTNDGIHRMADIGLIGGVPTWEGGFYAGVPVADAPANAGILP